MNHVYHRLIDRLINQCIVCRALVKAEATTMLNINKIIEQYGTIKEQKQSNQLNHESNKRVKLTKLPINHQTWCLHFSVATITYCNRSSTINTYVSTIIQLWNVLASLSRNVQWAWRKYGTFLSLVEGQNSKNSSHDWTPWLLCVVCAEQQSFLIGWVKLKWLLTSLRHASTVKFG